MFDFLYGGFWNEKDEVGLSLGIPHFHIRSHLFLGGFDSGFWVPKWWFCVVDGFDGGFVLWVDALVLLMVGFGSFGSQIGGVFLGHCYEILGRLLTAMSFWVTKMVGCG